MLENRGGCEEIFLLQSWMVRQIIKDFPKTFMKKKRSEVILIEYCRFKVGW